MHYRQLEGIKAASEVKHIYPDCRVVFKVGIFVVSKTGILSRWADGEKQDRHGAGVWSGSEDGMVA